MNENFRVINTTTKCHRRRNFSFSSSTHIYISVLPLGLPTHVCFIPFCFSFSFYLFFLFLFYFETSTSRLLQLLFTCTTLTNMQNDLCYILLKVLLFYIRIYERFKSFHLRLLIVSNLCTFHVKILFTSFSVATKYLKMSLKNSWGLTFFSLLNI